MQNKKQVVKKKTAQKKAGKFECTLYTGKGDDGFSCGMGGKRCAKHDPFLDVMGTFDECSVYIGLLRSSVPVKKGKFEAVKFIKPTQEALQAIASCLYTKKKVDVGLNRKLKTLTKNYEDFIRTVASPGAFVLPGDSLISSIAHLARVSARKLERACANPAFDGILTLEARAFLNRLSSFFFALSLNILENGY